ncbi:MAG TPA: helix-turn-helix domain-containing protein [Candidatus Paceibacterota bacterium]|nr:helix-turn-helix domain-containing protein [Candidatus Paceibacterota bacterium]
MSKNTDDSTVKRLEQLGLSEKEARVYVALLPYRDIGSSKLIHATGLHGQFVYDALEHLEELGLVKYVIQRGRKKFTANTPNRLLSLIDEKRLAAHSIAKELQQRFAGQREQDIEVYQGDEAFIARQLQILETMPADSCIDAIACETERYSATIKAYGGWAERERVRLDKRIRIRYLGTENQRTRLREREKEEPLFEYRIFPALYTGLVNTDIWPDNITLNIFGDPIVSLTITGKEIADGYRSFFEALWKLSAK